MSIKLDTTTRTGTLSSFDPSRRATLPEEHPSLSRLTPVEEALWEQLAHEETQVLENPTDPHLTQYLDTVRDLLNQALKRHQAKVSTYWSRTGRFRQMVHVVQINRALDDLLADIRQRRPAMEMARRLDAIRGLLLDLWM